MRDNLETKELSELREIATELALEFPKNISKAKLIDKIIADEEEVNGVYTEAKTVKAKPETVAQLKKRMSNLIRCKVSARDPQFHGRRGVTMQVGNSHEVVGKFIPFNVVWHAQEPVIQSLRRKKFRETRFETAPDGKTQIPVTTFHESFLIEELPQLTDKELKQLAADQSARGSIPKKQ